MNDRKESFEEQLRRLASEFEYPPTPDIQRWVLDELEGKQPWRFQNRPLAWTGAAILVLLIIMVISVPAARATLAETVRLGAVRIFLGREAASSLVTPRPTLQLPAQVTATGTPLPKVDFAGRTSLVAASEDFPVPILLPTYPPNIGEPDRVYLQEEPGPGVILLWLNEAGQPQLTLFELTPSAVYAKSNPTVIQRTLVDGEPALWTSGPYVVKVEGVGLQERRLIEGHVLIWTGERLTYRLETDLPLAEAVQIAESLR